MLKTGVVSACVDIVYWLLITGGNPVHNRAVYTHVVFATLSLGKFSRFVRSLYGLKAQAFAHSFQLFTDKFACLYSLSPGLITISIKEIKTL